MQIILLSYATRQGILTKIRACEQLQKFCEHKQASTHLIFASNSSKGKILRSLSNWMGPFYTPSWQGGCSMAVLLHNIIICRWLHACKPCCWPCWPWKKSCMVFYFSLCMCMALFRTIVMLRCFTWWPFRPPKLSMHEKLIKVFNNEGSCLDLVEQGVSRCSLTLVVHYNNTCTV